MTTSHDPIATAELRSERALFRLELQAMETRLRRDLIAWILIVHSATVIVLCLLVLALERSPR